MLTNPLKPVTPYRIQVLPPLNGRGWKQLIFKNVYIGQTLCGMFISVQCNFVHFVVLTKALFTIVHIHNTEL